MKNRKQKLIEKENQKEESNVKKEITRWWDLLGLKIMAFNNAEENQIKQQELEKEVKDWHARFDLKNKDNQSLMIRIRELDQKIEALKKEHEEQVNRICKNKDKKHQEKIKELKQRIDDLEETNAILKQAQVRNEEIIKGLSVQVNKKHRRKPQIKLTEKNLEEVKLWEKGQTVALEKQRERNK